MNILFFATAPSNEYQKIASFIFARIKELQNAGHRVTVLQRGNISIGFPNTNFFSLGGLKKIIGYFYKLVFCRNNILEVYEKDNVKYNYYNRLFFSSYKNFNKWYHENQFDFIHAHFLWSCNALPEIKKMCKIRYIVSVHGSDIHTDPYESEKARLFAKNILDCADGVFFVSLFLQKKAFELGYRKDNYLVTGNGYFNDIFFLKDKKPLDKNKVLLGYIGNPVEIKRFDILPDVLYEVKKQFPNTKLLCIGSTTTDVDLRDKVKKRLTELNIYDSVEFIDKVPYYEVADYMRRMDILLLPSKMEGFGCVALEAQACGTPVIASANGGIQEATGNIGLCVKESDNFIYDFACKVIDYIKKPLDIKTIVAASYGRTWKAVVEKEIEGYEKFIRMGKQQ